MRVRRPRRPAELQLFLVFANRDPFSDKGVLSIGFTSSVTYHLVDLAQLKSEIP
jgi:hypothetical protein